MVKPVNHDTTSALATGWWGTVKGAVVGGALVVGAGALLVGGAGALLGASAGIVGALAVLGGVLAGSVGGTFGAIVGGLTGLMSGGAKVSAQKAAYQARVNRMGGIEENKLAQAEMAGIQQGYQMGAAEAKQAIMAQLQQAHERMVMSNAGLGREPGAAAAKVDASRAAATPQLSA